MNDGRKDHVIEVSRSAYIEGSGSLWHLKGRMWRRRKKKLQGSSEIRETTVLALQKTYKNAIRIEQ